MLPLYREAQLFNAQLTLLAESIFYPFYESDTKM